MKTLMWLLGDTCFLGEEFWCQLFGKKCRTWNQYGSKNQELSGWRKEKITQNYSTSASIRSSRNMISKLNITKGLVSHDLFENEILRFYKDLYFEKYVSRSSLPNWFLKKLSLEKS